MAEVKYFHRACNCEVVTSQPELIQEAEKELSKLFNPKFPSRDIFEKSTVSYIRLTRENEKTLLTLVSRPFEREKNNYAVNQLTKVVNQDIPEIFHSRRSAEKWEIAKEETRLAEDSHLHGYKSFGTNKTFNKTFTVEAKAPDWLSLGIKGSDQTIELLHRNGFSHVHPERRTIEDIPASDEFKSHLLNSGFEKDKLMDLYYWESHSRGSIPYDSGWIAIDVSKNLVSSWTQSTKQIQHYKLENRSVPIDLAAH